MALAGGAIVGGSIAWQWPPFAAILGMVVLTRRIIGLFLWFARPRRQRRRTSRRRRRRLGVGSVAWYGFEAMAVGIALFLISDGTASIVGAIAWLFGLVTVKIGAMPYLESRGERIGRTVRILVDITLAGLFVLFAGAFASNSVLLLLGLSVVTAALSMVGVGALHIACPQRTGWWAMGFALAGMVSRVGVDGVRGDAQPWAGVRASR